MWHSHPDQELLAQIGHAIRVERIANGLRQDDLAQQAAVGKAAVQRLESGEAVRTNTLLRVLRVLKMLDRLELAFVTTEPASPLDLPEEAPARERVRLRTGARA